ncbi:MAG TPA: tRNA dihydrouridine synthase DusB [Burkholderiales bacterium]|nr:tRNA dihydrouridine synthase DusB [Burkholderiales bacterium]
MQIGRHAIPGGLVAAPMAGVTDRAFRRLCRDFGAGLAVSEMVSAKPELQSSAKTRRRLDHAGEPGPIAVQIVGGDPQQLATAARVNVDGGAQIIDINMGCPAKKVCNVHAGSALLADEPLVARILMRVVGAVDVPVTLKLRTGPDVTNRNAVRVARIAEEAGVKALAIHGRTRACGFNGHAEYDTIAAVKAEVRIPVIANGDIDSPEMAKAVLERTRADGVMIGRAAQGRPWLFREIRHFLEHGRRAPPPATSELRAVLGRHLRELHDMYGEHLGVRIARKHVGWYLRSLDGATAFRARFNTLETAAAQLTELDDFLARQADHGGAQQDRRQAWAA